MTRLTLRNNVHDNLNILFNESHTEINFHYALYSIAGQLVYTSQAIQLVGGAELALYHPNSSGIYIIRVLIDNGVMQNHLVIFN